MTGTFDPACGSQAQMTLSSPKKKSILQLTKKKIYSSDKKLLGTFSLNHQMDESKDRLLDSDEAIQKQSFAHFVQDYNNMALFKRSHSTQQVNNGDKNEHNLSEQQPN
jgi:hypothetical protein